jgi:aspartate/methionine/tyrosine aminotransferase
MDRAELIAQRDRLRAAYDELLAAHLDLDLTRGKPSPEQLDLSAELDSCLAGATHGEDGTDLRNYGGLAGLPEIRRFGAELLDLDPAQVLAGGNSSLTLMHQYLTFAWFFGLAGRDSAWAAQRAGGRSVRFLCPCPGYDRHFAICEQLGIDMIPVPFVDEGPDMDRIEALVAEDPLIKGIWCVPKYSNPTGHVYSDRVVERMARLPRIAGEHFRIMWDNAYAVHHLGPEPARLAPIYPLCVAHGTQDAVVLFGSTSKITWAGAGIAFIGASPASLKAFQDYLSIVTIGPDKVNQFRHVRFFGGNRTLAGHMARHRDLLKPRFDAVDEILRRDLAGTGMGVWSRPEGGYFVSFDSLPGLARRIAALAAEAGVKLTPAGSTFPYRRDPADCNIRIAPSYPSVPELRRAMEAFTLCVRLASMEHRLA